METKVIFVDSVPVICAECDYAEIRGNELFCVAKKKRCYNAKPEWCPIRIIPNELNEEELREQAISEDCYDGTDLEDWYISGKVRGWNSLLKIIVE